MGIETPQILQGLPITAQAAMDPNSPALNGGASGTPAPLTPQPAPAVPAPVAAAAGQPSDVGELPTNTGAPVHSMASLFMQHLISKDQQASGNAPAGAPPPGSFASKLAGAASALGTGLGDMRTGGDPSKGHGWLGAVGATLNARTERLAQEKKDQILLAKSQAEMVAMHRNFYQQDLEHRQQFHEGNKAFFAPYSESNEQESGVSQEEVMNRMKEDPKFIQNYLVRATGEVPVADANGNEQMEKSSGLPVMKPTYTIMKIATKDGSPAGVTVDAQRSADYAKYAGKSYPVGTKLTVLQDNAISAKMVGVRDAATTIQKANGKPLDTEQLASLRPALDNIEVQHALSSVRGDAVAGVRNALDDIDKYHIPQAQAAIAAAQKSGNAAALDTAQQGLQKAQKAQGDLESVLSMGFNDKAVADYDKKYGNVNTDISEMEKGLTTAKSAEETASMGAQSEEMLKSGALTQDQRTRLQQINKQAKLAETAIMGVKNKDAGGTGFKGDPNATTPEAFLKSLSPDEQSLVGEIGTGKIVLNRLDYLAAKKPEILEAVSRAYPDFDSSKAQSYPKTYADYTSGKTSVMLNSGGTAMGHLKELRDLNTAASHIPHTPAWTAYQNKVDTLATELAKFYGDTTVPAIAFIKETLASTLPGNREAAIKTQAQSMNDKLEAFEQEWANAAPSKAYEAPMPHISTYAKQAFASLNPDYAARHPELQSTKQGPANNPPTAQDDPTKRPKGTTGIVQGSDGNWYYHDIKHNILGPAPKQE